MPTAALEAQPGPASADIRARIRDLKSKRDKLKQGLTGVPTRTDEPKEDESGIKKLLGKFYRPEPMGSGPGTPFHRDTLEAELETVEASIDRLRSTLDQTKEEEREATIAALLPEYRQELKRLLETVSLAVQLTEQVSDLEYAMADRYSYTLKNHTIHGFSLRTSATLKEWMERVERFLGQTP